MYSAPPASRRSTTRVKAVTGRPARERSISRAASEPSEQAVLRQRRKSIGSAALARS